MNAQMDGKITDRWKNKHKNKQKVNINTMVYSLYFFATGKLINVLESYFEEWQYFV